MRARDIFNLLNRINHTPSISEKKIDDDIGIKETVNAVLTSPDGKKTHLQGFDD